MDSKAFIWIGLIAGSTVGGFIPTLWGADAISFTSVIFFTIGGFLGIWWGFQQSKL